MKELLKLVFIFQVVKIEIARFYGTQCISDAYTGSMLKKKKVRKGLHGNSASELYGRGVILPYGITVLPATRHT